MWPLGKAMRSNHPTPFTKGVQSPGFWLIPSVFLRREHMWKYQTNVMTGLGWGQKARATVLPPGTCCELWEALNRHLKCFVNLVGLGCSAGSFLFWWPKPGDCSLSSWVKTMLMFVQHQTLQISKLMWHLTLPTLFCAFVSEHLVYRFQGSLKLCNLLWEVHSIQFFNCLKLHSTSNLPWVNFWQLTSVDKANSGFLNSNSTLPERDFKEINILKKPYLNPYLITLIAPLKRLT